MAKLKRAQQSRANVSCKSITDLIWKYVSDRLDPTLKREFEEHLRICPDCVNFLNTYKKTVSLARSISARAIPAKVRANVRAFLRQKIRRLATILFYFLSSMTG
ncbi:MAG: anti-sigma factor family protein [Candidatus Binatia bacterium]